MCFGDMGDWMNNRSRSVPLKDRMKGTREAVFNKGSNAEDGSSVGSAVSSYAKTVNNSVATQRGGSPRKQKGIPV